MNFHRLSLEQREIYNLIESLVNALGCTLVDQNQEGCQKIVGGDDIDGRICLYIEFKGPNTRRFPANSIHATAGQMDCLADARFKKGNLVYGPSFDVLARPENTVEVALLLEFICKAIWCQKTR
jgi:hypothetical protein